MTRRLAFLLCFLLFLTSAVGFSQSTEGLRLSADSVSRDYETKTVRLEGSVEIAFGDQLLKADKAVVHLETSAVEADGNVVLVLDKTVIEGSHLSYNYKTRLGKIREGFVQNGPVVFEGKLVEKTGENTYVAEDAKFTSCTNCPPAWSFSGKRIDAEMGGYAFIKYPILRISDFPVFILPRILVPLKSDRQSGFLVPSLDFSKKGGAAITQSYFWAISRSQDATLSLKQYEKRGTKGMLEYRYVLGQQSKGALQSGYMRDEAYSPSATGSDSGVHLERGFFVYRHHHELPEGFVQRVNLNYVTDLRYVRDFSEDLAGHGDPALENSASITQNTENTHRSAEIMYHLNLLKDEDAETGLGDAFSRNDDAVHKWPEIRYSVVETELGKSGFFYQLDTNYTHFARRDRSYDENPQAADTDFDPSTDFIRTGHRLIVTPQLSYPVKIGKVLNLTPSVTYSESQYRFTATPETAPGSYVKNAARRYVQTDVELSTVFTRIFALKGEDRLKHEVIPELRYSEIPWKNLPDHPFFGDFEDQPFARSFESLNQVDWIGPDVDGKGSSRLQFDYRDRLFDKQLLTFALTNNFVRKSVQAERSTYHKLVTFRLQQSYDMTEARRENPQPWSAVHASLDARFKSFETYTVSDYYPYADVTNWSSRVRFMSQLGNYFQLTYAYKKHINAKNKPTGTVNENLGVGLGFKTRYFDMSGVTNYSMITSRLESWEYVAAIKPPGECWNLQLGHKQTLGSDTVFKINFNFEFGGGGA